MTLKLNPSVFREYDIRGIAGHDLSPDFARCLGHAYSKFLREKLPIKDRTHRVSVGWDCRLTSDSYAAGLVEGLRSEGIDVVRLGVCATPLTYFSIFHLELDGGIMITGSHNPADYNGFKICVGKDTLHGSQIQELRGLMESAAAHPAPPSSANGAVSDYAIIPAYQEHLVRNARPTKPFKIVLDAGNGTASTIAPDLFRRLGATVIPLFCELDGRFPNHHPDPTVPANLKDLVATVRKEGAAFGLAFAWLHAIAPCDTR
jgi:phosphomannomutase/phosphoglucomutase